MKKATLLAAAAVLLISTSNANAEFVLGGGVGLSKINPDFASASASEKSSVGIGVFGQFRALVSERVILGVHLGYSTESAELKGNIPADRPQNPFLIEVEIENVIDLLGLAMFPQENYTPFVMLGYSRAKVDATRTEFIGELRNGIVVDRHPFVTDISDTVTGAKVAFGADFRTSGRTLWQLLTYYAEYEEDDLEADQTGFRIRFGYRF